MKCALIHYDVNRISNEPGNKTVMKHFGHMPNIQLLYVAGVLEKIGVGLAYYDIVGMDLSNFELEKRLKSFAPDLIGLSVYTSHFHQAKSYVAYLKSFLPDVKIILGGIHCAIYSTETMRQIPAVDFACTGEAEMVLPEFIKRWEKRESFEGIRGLVWRDGDNIKYAGKADLCQDLDSVPFPARHLIPNHKYYNFISTRRNYTVLNTSRGCPFHCIFCEAGGQKWRARSPENIAAEFAECYEKYGIREIDIFDSSFTINKERVMKVCNLLIKNGLAKKMIWDVRSRVDTIDEEMLEIMKKAGCYRIFYGIESGNSEILKKIRKASNVKRIEEIIKKTDKIGISAFGYFLIGSPGETLETCRQTINFAKRLPLDFAIFNCLVAFPKTELYEKYYLPYVTHDFWNNYIVSPEPVKIFMGRPWTKISDERLRRIAHKAMLGFYFRPGQLYRTIRSIGSVEQFRRYLNAGWDMFWAYFKKK
ncbi:MAG: radical SAM protein [Planctomycetota bacterium]